MEVLFLLITFMLAGASAALIFGQKAPARIVVTCCFIAIWLVLWLFVLFFLPLAQAQPFIYFKSETENVKTVTDQAELFLADSALKDIISIVSKILSGIPLTLSSVWLPLTLLDGQTLLNLAFVAVSSVLLMIITLIFAKIQLASIAIIALNSLLIFMLISAIPSVDQLGALDNSATNFILSALGITYGNAIVFILLTLVAFNAAHAWWIASDLSLGSSGSVASKAQRTQPTPSRFSPVASSAPNAQKRGKNILVKRSARSINAISALVALATGVALLVSSFFLPLISYSKEACAKNMATLNGTLSEMQRLRSNLPAEVQSQLSFLPSAVNDPQDLFPQPERKALVRTICSEDVWTNSFWLLQNSSGFWTPALLLTVTLSALLIFVGATRTSAASLATTISVLSLVTILALVHALATVETFGYHDDLTFRVIGVLGATQPDLGAWIPLLISVIVLPVFLPFYLRQSSLLS